MTRTFLILAITLALVVGVDILGRRFTHSVCDRLSQEATAVYTQEAEGNRTEAQAAFLVLSRSWQRSRPGMNLLFDHVHVGDVDDILAQLQPMLARNDPRSLPMLQLLLQHISEFPDKLEFSLENIL